MEDLTELPPGVVEGETVEGPPRIQIPRADLLVAIAIILGTLAAYSSVVGFGFLSFDDQSYVAQNTHLQDGFAMRNLRWIFLSFKPDNWFPVTRVSLVIDYGLFGLRAGWYHAENVVIHILAALLLFGFLRRATLVRWPAAFVAFVFALHPLHVESVAWVAERKDVLCAFFWFATLWAWLRYTERPCAGRYIGALTLFVLGLMSKPMIVTLPFLLFLLDFWPLRRAFSRKIVIEKIPFIVLSCAVMGITMVAQHGAMVAAPPLLPRLENVPVTVVLYIAHALWPARLAAIYSFPVTQPILQAVFSLAGIVSVSVIVWRQMPKRPYLAVGWFWFLGTLIPVLGLVQVGVQARADRYMYVPLVGLSIMAAWGFTEVAVRLPAPRRWAGGLVAAVFLAMAVLTWFQTRYWKTTEELFQHAVDADSQNYLAWTYLGIILAGDDWFAPDVISCYRRALQIRPDMALAHSDLAGFLCKKGRTWEGIAEYREALRIDPSYERIRFSLARALWDSDRREEAIGEYEAELRINPNSASAHTALGAALANTGHLAEGVAQMERGVRLDPGDAYLQFNLGNALADSPGRSADAIAHLTEALRIDPGYADAHTRLAAVLIRIPGRREEALAHLEAAQQIVPDPDKRKQLDDLEMYNAINAH